MKSHDIAARRIARKAKSRYIRGRIPDVKCPRLRAEVITKTKEITEALRNLGGGSGPAYVALPTREHPKAQARLRGLKTGLMDYMGNIKKRSTRK